MALGASIVILAFLPWLDTSKVRSARYRPLYRQFFWLFVIVCIGLGWLGSKPPEGNYVLFARIFTAYYFAYFLIILPILGCVEKTKPLPNSITESVLREGVPIGASAPPPSARRPEHGNAMAFHAHDPRSRRRACRARRSGAGAGSRHADAAEAQMVVLRTVRQIRPRAAAARLQGLSRGLPSLSRPQAAVVPQSRRARRTRLHDRAGRRDCRRISGQGRARRPGRGQGSSRPARPIASRRRSPTTMRRARATTRCRRTCR